MTDLCGAEHPERPEVTCDKPLPCYHFHSSREHRTAWGSQPAPPKRGRSETKTRVKVDEMASRAAKKTFVREHDLETAHEAIERYEPHRDTAKGRVLAYLREHAGQWVDAPDLTTPEVGGFAGTRRLRELRDDGWPIETRPKPGETNLWQHRLGTDLPG